MKEAANDFIALNKIWDLHNEETGSLGSNNLEFISSQCAGAIQSNYTVYEKDALKLPLIVDLIDAGGKLGPG